MDLIPSVISDLIAGLAATGIVASGALLARKVGWRVVRVFSNLLGWPFIASVFFGVSLLSAFLRGAWLERFVVLSILLAVTASVMLLRFGPERIQVSAPATGMPC